MTQKEALNLLYDFNLSTEQKLRLIKLLGNNIDFDDKDNNNDNTNDKVLRLIDTDSGDGSYEVYIQGLEDIGYFTLSNNIEYETKELTEEEYNSLINCNKLEYISYHNITNSESLIASYTNNLENYIKRQNSPKPNQTLDEPNSIQPFLQKRIMIQTIVKAISDDIVTQTLKNDIALFVYNIHIDFILYVDIRTLPNITIVNRTISIYDTKQDA